jgi:hypothetical protein
MAEQESMNANLQAEYREVCNNFRLLTDIRFKLLALLPIGTGAGVALTLAQSGVSNRLIGLFGLLVTSSAALYNLRNDQLYNDLVGRAAQLERSLNLKGGGFAQRPRAWRRAGPFKVSHGQIWWIYLSSLAAWLFAILHGVNVPRPSIVSGVPTELVEAAVALALVLLIALCVWLQGYRTSNRLRNAARAAVEVLRQIPISPAPEHYDCWAPLLRHASVLAGQKTEQVERRLLFYLRGAADLYWERPAAGQTCDVRAAAQLLGLVTDMPSRWISDVASGRRA